MGVKIAASLREAAERLAGVSDTARLDAELLMAEALGVSRTELLLRHMDDEVPDSFAGLLERRLHHEPVAYITGHQEFYGLDLEVTPDVLIPRADSETTVGAALEACPSPMRVLDCGVGSGALLLSVLFDRPHAQGIGVDRSKASLAVADSNAERLGIASQCRLVLRDWNVAGWADDLGRFDLIICNPPYVEESAKLPRSVREFEPAEALFAGKDGLDAYRVLIPQLPELLAADGVAVVEIGASQAETVAEIAEKAGFSFTLHKDLAQRPRALVLRLGLGKDSVGR